MRKLFYILHLLTALFVISSCSGGKPESKIRKIFRSAAPQLEAHYDRSTPPKEIDIEQGLKQPQELKLSQVASSIEYYLVGNWDYMVTQVIELPDSNAFITFNYPRIYYRKAGSPSKRYGFKALAYKWNSEMNGSPLFYDKKTTRMYAALSGKTVETRQSGGEGHPSIGELPPLDTMLTISSYVYPETLPANYPLNTEYGKLLGFSSSGYTLSNSNEEYGEPDGITTYNLEGDIRCRFKLKEGQMALRSVTENIPFFQTSSWNTEQDKMTFMIPYCDTVYQLRDSQTVAPLYAIRSGEMRVNLKEVEEGIPAGKAWLKTFHENPKGLFMGLFSKGSPAIKDENGNIVEYKPSITHQVAYLKGRGETFQITGNQGIINDLDEGFNFWPDGQFDDCLFMTRTVGDARNLLKRKSSPKLQKLIDIVSSSNVRNDDHLIIIIR